MSNNLNLISPVFQSPYTYMQAAGSDGTDESVPGIHLRWDFLRTLGDEHFAKGDLSGPNGSYPSSTGFNKDGDFVKIYRVPFREDFAIHLALSEKPDIINQTGSQRFWRYNNLLPPANQNNELATDVIIKFLDLNGYDATLQIHDPNVDPESFFNHYNGIVEFQTPGALMFQGNFELLQTDINDAALAQMEVIAQHHQNYDDQDLNNTMYIACRKTLDQNDYQNNSDFVCENILKFRFRLSNFSIRTIKLFTYKNQILGEYDEGNQNNWEFLDKFSLDDGQDDSSEKVLNRLEDTSLFEVDGHWPKYNDANSGTGEFTVKVQNYIDRWFMQHGIQQGVKTYLQLSTIDPSATTWIEDTEGNTALQVSYHELLKFVSIDYHVARMLGLGHIDPLGLQNGIDGNTQYLYLLSYVTQVTIENTIPGETVTHLYMSLPTNVDQNRYAAVPELEPLTYGIPQGDEFDDPYIFTDENGYIPNTKERIINLSRKKFRFEKPMENFMAGADFCICQDANTVALGIEYRKEGELHFRKPELTHDTKFLDHAGLPETIISPLNNSLNVYRHFENQEGIHEYALYSINWFSRTSGISNLQQTDFSSFKKLHTLLPPANLAVQLIQQESPTLLTTTVEQEMLANISGSDKTLVRVTFDWDSRHNLAYQFGNYAELFFRTSPPKIILGKITGVIQLPGNLAKITTGSIQVNSTDPAQQITPNIPIAQVAKFIGSVLVVDGNAFVVEDIQTDSQGDNPTLIVHQIRETNVFEPKDTNEIVVGASFLSPKVNTNFLLSENLNSTNDWEAKLIQKVFIESFHTVYQFEVINSQNELNDGTYTLVSTGLDGNNTQLKVLESILNENLNPLGEILFQRQEKVINHNPAAKSFTLQGNLTADLNTGMSIYIFGANEIDGIYTVSTVNYTAGSTVVVVNENFTTVNGKFYMLFNKTIQITGINQQGRFFTVSGDLTDELIPVHFETQDYENETKIIPVGGIYDLATITAFEDVDDSGNILPGTQTGVYLIEFNNFKLSPHIQQNVAWYKGGVKIIEDASFLPPFTDPARTQPILKHLQVWNIDNSGSTLKLIVADPTFQKDGINDPPGYYIPIKIGANVEVNFHPSYRAYFMEDTVGSNNFSAQNILPQAGGGTRQTFMAIRSIDTQQDPVVSSFISKAAIINALEISQPIPPGIPQGSEFATRPDFYGKASYTFDVQVDTSNGRQPHNLVFYRCNERKILDTLYLPQTVADILNTLETLPFDDKRWFKDRWSDFVNVHLDSNGLFKKYEPEGFHFPIPDNSQYTIPQDNATLPPVYPFDGTTPPGNMVDIVKDAINNAFQPLSEQPLIYHEIKTGRQTSNVKPITRDLNGLKLQPNHPDYNAWPMSVKYTDGNETYVRFSDYSLDGAAKNFYFYFARELSNQLKFSERSEISGPINLVNAAPAEAPEIRKVTTQLANSIVNTPVAIAFELNHYIAAENITKVQIFRSLNHSDALSVRTMKPVKFVAIPDEAVIDDFSDVNMPLFGEPLFYRVVAYRSILNEANEPELIPSKPSNIVLTTLVDNQNPAPPELSFSSDPLSGSPAALQNIVLSWEPTCYNGTYHLFSMTSAGNWQKIYSVKSNNPMISVPLEQTELQTDTIIKEDEEGLTIYKRFRVQVENASGLLNLTEFELTI